MARGGITAKTSGYLITEYHDGTPALIQETVQCAHCQRHKVYDPKTVSKEFAYCCLCARPVCNEAKCQKCVPAEQWLENVEQGLPEDNRKIIASSGFGPS